MKTALGTKCCKMVYPVGLSFARGTPCGRPGKVEHEGNWYCGVHDPVKRKARADDRAKIWRAQSDARRAAIQRSAQLDDALALCRRVARLNKDAGEIGAGMLAQLVDEARRILEAAGVEP